MEGASRGRVLYQFLQLISILQRQEMLQFGLGKTLLQTYIRKIDISHCTHWSAIKWRIGGRVANVGSGGWVLIRPSLHTFSATSTADQSHQCEIAIFCLLYLCSTLSHATVGVPYSTHRDAPCPAIYEVAFSGSTGKAKRKWWIND